MPKMMTFSNMATQNVLDSLNGGFLAFSELMKDVAKGIDTGVSKEKANDKIREVMFEVLGVPADTKGRELRRAIRRHKVDVFEIIETTVEDMLVSGWGKNTFFDEFVEVKNAESGDTNSFYTEDRVVLTVSELAGNHHNLNVILYLSIL